MSTSLLISTYDLSHTKKTIAKPSRQSFRLTLDDDTHRELVSLQRGFSSTVFIPSRTVLVRLALRRLAADVRAHRGNFDWLSDCSRDLRYLAHAGSK
jgi:hypothetical protein